MRAYMPVNMLAIQWYLITSFNSVNEGKMKFLVKVVASRSPISAIRMGSLEDLEVMKSYTPIWLMLIANTCRTGNESFDTHDVSVA